MVSYEELKEKGYFVVPTDPNWQKYPAGMKSFYDDPENNPLTTPSGKIEFYSEALAKHFPAMRKGRRSRTGSKRGKPTTKESAASGPRNILCSRYPITVTGEFMPIMMISPGLGKRLPVRSRVLTVICTSRCG